MNAIFEIVGIVVTGLVLMTLISLFAARLYIAKRIANAQRLIPKLVELMEKGPAPGEDPIEVLTAYDRLVAGIIELAEILIRTNVLLRLGHKSEVLAELLAKMLIAKALYITQVEVQKNVDSGTRDETLHLYGGGLH